MKNRNLLDAFGQIDEELALDAEEALLNRTYAKTNQRKRRLRVLLAAAGIAAAVAVIALLVILPAGKPEGPAGATGPAHTEESCGSAASEKMPAGQTEPATSTKDEEPQAQSAAQVYLDVNPGLRLDVDGNGDVLTLSGTNNDGEKLIKLYHAPTDSAEDTVGELIGLMIEKHYLKKGGTVLLSVVSGSRDYAKKLGASLKTSVETALAGQSVEAEVIAQELVDDETVSRFAEIYGVSEGKAALCVRLIAAGCKLPPAELAKEDLGSIAIQCRVFKIITDDYDGFSFSVDELFERSLEAFGVTAANTVQLVWGEDWRADGVKCVDASEDDLIRLDRMQYPSTVFLTSEAGVEIICHRTAFWYGGTMYCCTHEISGGILMEKRQIEAISPHEAVLHGLETLGARDDEVLGCLLIYDVDGNAYTVYLRTFDGRIAAVSVDAQSRQSTLLAESEANGENDLVMLIIDPNFYHPEL